MNWRDGAACRGMDTELFFPDSKDWRSFDAARAVCESCPVSDDCLLEHIHERYGVFGGATPTQRRELRKQMGIDPLGVPEAKHGTPSRYRHHGCRCRICSEAQYLAVQLSLEKRPRPACA